MLNNKFIAHFESGVRLHLSSLSWWSISNYAETYKTRCVGWEEVFPETGPYYVIVRGRNFPEGCIHKFDSLTAARICRQRYRRNTKRMGGYWHIVSEESAAKYAEAFKDTLIMPEESEDADYSEYTYELENMELK